MKIYQRLVFLMLVVGLLFGSFLIPAGAKEVFTVGTEGVYAPFTYMDEKNNLTGYDVEVVKAIAKKLQAEVKFVPTPWDSMFLSLETKKFDLIANEIGKNPEREKKYLFSDSYLISGAQIIVKADKSGISTLDDLKGLKVGIGVGSNYAKLLEDANKDKKIDIKYYDGNMTTVLQDIVAGRIDATVNDRLTVGYNVKKLGLKVKLAGKPLALVPSFFVFRQGKEGEALKEQFNKALVELKKDGTLVDLSLKWFGADFTQ